MQCKAGAKFRSLADAWADTTTPHRELMVTVLRLATFERHLIRARTDEGRKRAQARDIGGAAPTHPDCAVARERASAAGRQVFFPEGTGNAELTENSERASYP